MTRTPPHCLPGTHAEGEVPLMFGHGAEEQVHRFPGSPETFCYDKAVNSVAF